jgi:hypothetical protein
MSKEKLSEKVRGSKTFHTDPIGREGTIQQFSDHMKRHFFGFVVAEILRAITAGCSSICL